MISLPAWVSKWESQRRSERLKATVVTRRNRAGAIGQRAGWGGGTKGGHGGKLASPEDAAGWASCAPGGPTVREIAAAVGLSKSQVGRLLSTRA